MIFSKKLEIERKKLTYGDMRSGLSCLTDSNAEEVELMYEPKYA